MRATNFSTSLQKRNVFAGSFRAEPGIRLRQLSDVEMHS